MSNQALTAKARAEAFGSRKRSPAADAAVEARG